MKIKQFIVCIALSCLTFDALAFERAIPPSAKIGTMTPAQYPAIIIDKEVRTLSPGAQIRNEANLIVTPMSLQGQDIPVRFQEDGQGAIHRVWILSDEEAAQSSK